MWFNSVVFSMAVVHLQEPNLQTRQVNQFSITRLDIMLEVCVYFCVVLRV